MEGAHPTLTLVLALAVGVIAQASARHLRIPGIALLLLAGVAFGPDGIGLIDPRALGGGLPALISLAVAVILFEGGLNLDISRLRREQGAIRRLVSLGALITWFGAGLSVFLIMGWRFELAVLFGSLVVVTGPTVIGPLMSDLRLRARTATLLEAEGVLIDPVGAILAALVLDLVLSRGVGVGSEALHLLEIVGLGAGAGLGGGALLALALRSRRLVPEGLENILTLSLVLVLFEVCERVAPESGILAVTLAGVVVGNLRTRVDRDLREFKDQLTVLFIGLLFVLLAADVRLADLYAMGAPAAWVVAALIFVVRPLNVFVSTMGTGMTWRERALVSWIAPRGIVAAAIASVVAAALDERGIAGGNELRALVFLTISGTVLQAGFTAKPLAMLLGLRLPGRDRVAVLGAKGLGIRLAQQLVSHGVDVVIIDSNPRNCRRAEEAGLPVVFGNALEDRTLQRARVESIGTVVGLTSNDELNGLFVTRAREFFSVPQGYVALNRAHVGLSPELVHDQEDRVLFEGAHDVDRWDVRDRHEEIQLEQRVYQPLDEPAAGDQAAEPDGSDAAEPPGLAQSGERYIFLCVRRGSGAFPMFDKFEPREGDRAAVAIHLPDLEEADRALRALGWVVAEPEPDDAEASDAA